MRNVCKSSHDAIVFIQCLLSSISALWLWFIVYVNSIIELLLCKFSVPNYKLVAKIKYFLLISILADVSSFITWSNYFIRISIFNENIMRIARLPWLIPFLSIFLWNSAVLRNTNKVVLLGQCYIFYTFLNLIALAR